MKLALDVQYGDGIAAGAAVGFSDWEAPVAKYERTILVSGAEKYEPGAFFKRELPVLRAVLDATTFEPSLIVVDGYVWLGPERPGLGWYLHDALERRVPVVGVAKRSFAGGQHAEQLCAARAHAPVRDGGGD